MWPSQVHYHQAIRALRQGQIISYPTESVFGLGCDPHNLNSVNNILLAKQRSWQKGLILIASEIEQLEPWIDWARVPNIEKIYASWPGPETWIVPVADEVSPLLRGLYNSLAVRVSAHPVVQQLCDQFAGAIVSTSANKAGNPAPKSSFQVRKTFKDSIGFYMTGATSKSLRPSRIRSALTGETLRP